MSGVAKQLYDALDSALLWIQMNDEFPLKRQKRQTVIDFCAAALAAYKENNMPLSDQALTEAISATRFAPKVTPNDVNAVIKSESYYTPPDHPQVTICILTTYIKDFVVVGVNEGPVNPANFDAEIGQALARQKAIDQLWPLMGFLFAYVQSEKARVLFDELPAQPLSPSLHESSYYQATDGGKNPNYIDSQGE